MADYNRSKGWLTLDGCGLDVGRPPVCYEFYCSAIISGISGAYRKYAADVLGKLVSFAGRNALGNRHLVTLSTLQLRSRVDYFGLQRRIKNADVILGKCIDILRTDSACHSALVSLKAVLKIPEALK